MKINVARAMLNIKFHISIMLLHNPQRTSGIRLQRDDAIQGWYLSSLRELSINQVESVKPSLHGTPVYTDEYHWRKQTLDGD